MATQKFMAGRKPQAPLMAGISLTKEYMVAAIANKMGDAVGVFRVVVPDGPGTGENALSGEWWIFDCFTAGENGMDRMTLRMGGDMLGFTEKLYNAARGISNETQTDTVENPGATTRTDA